MIVDRFSKQQPIFSGETTVKAGAIKPPDNYEGNPAYGRFRAPGLRWDGRPAVTTNKLQATAQQNGQMKNRGSRTDGTSFTITQGSQTSNATIGGTNQSFTFSNDMQH